MYGAVQCMVEFGIRSLQLNYGTKLVKMMGVSWNQGIGGLDYSGLNTSHAREKDTYYGKSLLLSLKGK